MAVSYVVHGEFTHRGRDNTVLTFRDMTLTLSGDEGGGENELLAEEIGFKTILFCSNGRVPGGGDLIITAPSGAGVGLSFLYKPQIVGSSPATVSMMQTAYNGEVRLVVIGTA